MSSNSEESPSALSDPLPRIYSCFCEKIFTTYPGIYLHLKSKHGHLFQKYKKLKITKLFKKIKNEAGSEIYKLDKLIDKESSSNYFSQKKIKQNKKRINAPQPQINIDEDQQSNQKQLKRSTRNQQILLNHQNERKQIKNPPPPPPPFNFPLQFNHSMFELAYKAFANSPTQPPPPPFFGFPHANHQAHSFPHLAHLPPFPFPPFPNFKTESTIKKLLQGFLNRAEQRKIYNLLQLKDSLYDLMVFIDKNCEFIPDPRIKEKIVFSYCDQFEPRYIGTLLNQFIKQKKEAELQKEQQQMRGRQIGYIENFSSWLRQIGLLENTVPQVKERPIMKKQLGYLCLSEEKSQ